jgi:hypothetical protein
MDGVDALGRPVVVLNAGEGLGGGSCPLPVASSREVLLAGPACCGGKVDGQRINRVLPPPPPDAVPSNMKSSALIYVKAHLEPLVNQVCGGGGQGGWLVHPSWAEPARGAAGRVEGRVRRDASAPCCGSCSGKAASLPWPGPVATLPPPPPPHPHTHTHTHTTPGRLRVGVHVPRRSQAAQHVDHGRLPLPAPPLPQERAVCGTGAPLR